MSKSILIIVENAPVPFDTRVWKEATSLRENGYDVTVLCPRGKSYEEGYALIDGIHIYRHPLPNEGQGLSSYFWEYGCALWWELLFTWWIYFRRGFRVIQGCNPPDTIVLVAIPFKLLGVKYIFDHHDAAPELYVSKYGSKGLAYKVQLWLERLTFRFSDIVMATNHSYKELAVHRGGLSPDDVFVVRNGPDLTKFKLVPPDPSLKRGKRFLVGYVGTMAVQDGLDIVLEVAAHLKMLGHDDIQFTCVGGGPELESLRRTVRDKKLADFVHFAGRLPDADLLKILSTADVCVNPDRPCELNDMSTMIKIMEYMALGKPIVQFDSKEGRFSAQSASLYAGGSDPVGDFAAKILYLLDHPEERDRMGRVGRERVQKELAWEYSVAHLRNAYEHAFSKRRSSRRMASPTMSIDAFYYTVKPLIPRALQIGARRQMVRRIARQCDGLWPVREASGDSPPGWPGWPDGKRFALVLSHDVESRLGVTRCERLAELEEKRGLRSSFGFVPLRYQTPDTLRRTLGERGFEVMVHDLQHDGKLYRSRSIFEQRQVHIDYFLRQWGASGFSSGSMHHNLSWISHLDIDYDLSTFDVDPFEPQACGLGRIFPCWVESPNQERPGFVELPYTLPQDFTLFVLLRERTNVVWRQRLDRIAEKGGMALIKTHPDYMAFEAGDRRMDHYPVELYTEFLDYINSCYAGQFWIAQPSEVARYWRGLRPAGIGTANTIPASPTLCASCRQAHAEGWLTHYPREQLAVSGNVGTGSSSAVFLDGLRTQPDAR
jgi:glycosyltransferase involved in cell wall biosynthesis